MHLATRRLDLERAGLMCHLEPGLAAQQAQVPLLAIELDGQRGTGIQHSGTAIFQLHHARCIAAAQVAAC
ncbi:hypothetical protein G6F63_016072 [Rhizopus arrhizus]|nr:hypothetical protein G6F63_016072 [Rhizopus arrhizus]KAG1345156.1 hypothetical protein G6F61_014808 [Rhizopus arrhizus]KAG1364768.1 hypothetical protein G6F59_018922 [Rhizopus arrhizus]